MQKPTKIRVKCKTCGYPHYRLVSELKPEAWTQVTCQCGELIKFLPRDLVGTHRSGIH